MGNSETNATRTVPHDFPMQKYLNQGMNQNQILEVKEAFDSYEPENGLIDLNKLRQFAELDQPQKKIEKYLGNKSTMNFDEFFAMSRQLQEEIRNSKGMIIDNDQIEASCLFCPYAVDKKQ